MYHVNHNITFDLLLPVLNQHKTKIIRWEKLIITSGKLTGKVIRFTTQLMED